MFTCPGPALMMTPPRSCPCSRSPPASVLLCDLRQVHPLFEPPAPPPVSRHPDLGPLHVQAQNMLGTGVLVSSLHTGLRAEPAGAAVDCHSCASLASPHLQDEMELGYVQAPHKTLPVVFDSPRNGELQDFPYKRILVSGPRLQPTPES